MDYVACKIALGGDSNNVLYRGPDVPVSWPEVRVLQQLHGEDNVFDCVFVGTEPATPQGEKMRLLGLYGKTEAVGFCYPGSRPLMDMEFPGDRDPIAIELTEAQPDRRHQAIGQGPSRKLELHSPLPPVVPNTAPVKGQTSDSKRFDMPLGVALSPSCATS